MSNDDHYDVFISYASEDRDYPVRVIIAAFVGAGLRVWYDEMELKIGDSLRKSIDLELSKSTYGIIVLRKAFFSKQWRLNGNWVVYYRDTYKAQR